MVKGVGHGGGAMGWRGGGEVDRRQQQEVSMEKKKNRRKAAGLHFGETAPFH